MTSALRWLGAGIVLGAAGLGLLGRHQYAALKSYADSLAVASALADGQVRRLSDSVAAVIADLGTRKQRIITKVIEDTTKAESLLAVAKTASDSMEAYKSEVETLKTANRSLFQALAISDSMIAAEKFRGDSLERTVSALNGSMQVLVKRINSLHGTPAIVKAGIGIAALGAAAYGGYKLGQR